jgi:phosphoribosylformylglycinamidine synthase PurS subunit
MYTATIQITLRPSILDPKGKAAGEALSHLGYSAISNVRIGKYVRMSVDAPSEAEAYALAKQACEKLLANEVMEDFTITIEAA